MEHDACENCEVKKYIRCDAEKVISQLSEDKGIPADFSFCVFNRTARKFKLAIMRDILEPDGKPGYKRKTRSN